METHRSDPTPLVDKDLIRTWLYGSLAWLTIFPLVGLLVSIIVWGLYYMWAYWSPPS